MTSTVPKDCPPPKFITVPYDDPRIQLHTPEEIAAAKRMIGNRARRRQLAAELRAKSRV